MFKNNHFDIYRFGIFTIFTIFFLLYLFPINFAMPREGLDPSWRFVMDYAFNKDFLFPNDLLFTYGPFGNFEYPHVIYNKDILFLQYLIPILLTILIVTSLIKIFKKEKLLIVIISLTGIMLSQIYSSTFWFFLQFLFVFLVFNHKSKNDLLVIYLLVLTMAFSGLIKFSYVPSALLLVLFTDVFFYLTKKKAFPFTVVYIVSFVFFYLLSGQHIVDIGSFISGSWQLASGFAGSMQTTGPEEDLVIFFFLATIGFITLLYFIVRSKTYHLIYILLSSYLVLFVLFKAGFVRHDSHVLAAFSGLVLVFSFFCTLCSKVASKKFRFIVYLLLLISLCTLSFLIQRHWRTESSQTLKNYKSLDQKYKDSIYKIQIKHPLPKLKGTVDIYPWDQSYLLANELNYRPRPVFQSYAVYTPDLIQRNKKSLYSNTAPEYIFFTIKNIDGRHPGMMEGATWLDLMKLYDIVDTANEFYVLKSTKRDKNYSLQTLANIETSWNTDIKVPSEDKIYINIKIKKTLIGKLFQLLYKAPIVYIDITYLDGHHEKKRIIPSIASEGFILSPKISSASDFFKFSIGKLPSDAARKVKSIKLINDNTFVYSKSIDVSFHNIDTTGFTMSDNVSPKLKKRIKQEAFYKNIIKDNSKINNKMFLIKNYDNQKILFAHEGITFSVNSKIMKTEDNTSFKFGYGIVKGAYSGKNDVAGGCFNIYGVNGKDKQLLWHKCITPKQKKSDRGSLYDNFIIDNKFKTYEFSTTPIEGKPSAWGWTYWNFNGAPNESN